MTTLFEAAGGEAGLQALARAWHERVLADPVVSHAFHTPYRPDHVERLASYWAEALGGPVTFDGTEADVVRLHSGNGEHDDMNERAVACFAGALEDVGLDGRTAEALLAYFTWATWGPMYAFHGEVEGLAEDTPIPRWDWEGRA
jgi:truncated hemoglobin YjbI